MTEDTYLCQDCDEPVRLWSEFLAHANAGHAVTMGAAES